VLLPGVNKREQRSDDPRVDMNCEPGLQRNVFCEAFSKEADALRDHIGERDEHQHRAGNSENRAGAPARKPRRNMQEETEPAHHKHRKDAGNNHAFVILHPYASTVTGVRGLAWQARIMLSALSSSVSASWTAISTSPEVIFVLHTPQVPMRQEKSMPIPSSSDNSRIV